MELASSAHDKSAGSPTASGVKPGRCSRCQWQIAQWPWEGSSIGAKTCFDSSWRSGAAGAHLSSPVGRWMMPARSVTRTAAATLRRARRSRNALIGFRLAYGLRMFPISDVIPSRTTPVVTIGLIATNTLAFLYELRLGEAELDQLARTAGVIPAAFSLTDALTSLFLHGGWLHFLGNMLYLWIFGDNVEDRFGHVRFLLFYLACGAAAAFTQVVTHPVSTVPMIGASGAIAGVMGAYFVLFPQSRVLAAVFIIFIIDIIEIPALFFLGIWFLMQLFSGVGSLVETAEGGIAFFAHVGGFAAGAATGVLARMRANARRNYWSAL